MSKPLLGSLRPAAYCERYLQRCAHQRLLRDDLRPLLSPIQSHPSRQCPNRPFSSSSPHAAKGVVPKVKQRAQPSMNVERAKQRQQIFAAGQIPDDLGLMDGTFIMPSAKNRPSWTKEFKRRWKLERYRLGHRLKELLPLMNYRWIAVRPRPRLHLRTAAAAGKQMHRDMYTAFAAGNLKAVEGDICSGLLTSLRARIAQRPPNTHLQWTLHEYLSAPRLVSYRAGLLPGLDGKESKKAGQNGVVQAVVRIHSLQSLQHIRTSSVRERGQLIKKETPVDAQGRELSDAEMGTRRNAKETVEYFVIQKMLRKSKEGKWMVWGTAEETSLEKLERDQREVKRRPKRPGFWDGIRARLAGTLSMR